MATLNHPRIPHVTVEVPDEDAERWAASGWVDDAAEKLPHLAADSDEDEPFDPEERAPDVVSEPRHAGKTSRGKK